MPIEVDGDARDTALSIVYAVTGVVELTLARCHADRLGAVLSGRHVRRRPSANNLLTIWDASNGHAVRDIKIDRTSRELCQLFLYSPKAGTVTVGGVDIQGRGFVESWATDARKAKERAEPNPMIIVPAPG